MNPVCVLAGHKWVPLDPILYERGRTLAYQGDDPVPREVDVTWITDEKCERRGCNAVSMWPS